MELTLNARLGRPPVIGAPGIAAAAQVVGTLKDARTAAAQQRGTRAMEYFCGLDVGMDGTAIRVVDDRGRVMVEAAATEFCCGAPAGGLPGDPACGARR
ncbi:hypothetical protein ACVIGA_000606 [Bradyrhizobium sp. USDA 3240]